MHRVPSKSALVGVLAVAILAVGALRCARDVTRPTATGPSKLYRDNRTRFFQSEPYGDRRLRYAWVADVHDAAMTELLAETRVSRGQHGKSHARDCEAIARLGSKYFAVAETRAAKSLSDDPRTHQLLDAQLKRIGCSGYRIATGVTTQFLPAAYFAQTEEEVTETGLSYLNPMTEVFNSASGTNDIADGTNAILGSASGVNSADVDLMAALGNLQVSSAYYWYDVQSSGNCSTYLLDNCYVEAPLSIFPSKRMSSCGFWCRVGYADAAGFAGCVAAAWYTGYREPRGLAIVGTACAVLMSGQAALK